MTLVRIEIENPDGVIAGIWLEPDAKYVEFGSGQTLVLEVSPGGTSPTISARRMKDGTQQLYLFAPIRCKYSASIDGHEIQS